MAFQTTKEYRKELADIFIKALSEKQLDWKKEWRSVTPQNAKNGRKYKGINRFRLTLVAMSEGYEDPRWATFNQVKDLGLKLKNAKGKGVRVEYWFPYDTEKRKMIDWDEFNQMSSGFGDKRYVLRVMYSVVFNASLIDGIPPFDEPEKKDIRADELIMTLSDNMDVPIYNDGGDRAFYQPSEDAIHLPEPGYFSHEYAYNSTALHELAHSTGAPKRLNRNLGWGSVEYAYEELVAEITSCFMSAHLPIEQDEGYIDNHKAYVQSWIKQISEKPETLVKAISDAEKATAYMEYKGNLILKEEYEKVVSSSMEIDTSKAHKKYASKNEDKIVQLEEQRNKKIIRPPCAVGPRL